MTRYAIAALAAVSGLALAAASAARAQPGDGWSGPYLGAEAGGRWMSADGRVNAATDNGANILNPGGNTHGIGDSSSFVGGLYGGYNWSVAPNWIVGAEAQVDWGDNSSTLPHAIYPGNSFFVTGRPDDAFTARQDWDGSLRVRVGYQVAPNALLYATGGLAVTDVRTTSVCGVLSDCRPGVFAQLFAPAVINDSTTQTGWTLGGGVEWRLNSRWSVRGEYRYADYGDATFTETRVTPAGPTTQVANFTVDEKSSTATVGIAYRF